MNHQERAEYNGLSIAALVFGILAVLGSFTILATPLLASLAISFAWLSSIVGVWRQAPGSGDGDPVPDR